MAKKQVIDKAVSTSKTELMESCPRCNGKDFSVEIDGVQRRYCRSCSHVWGAMSKEQLEIQAIKGLVRDLYALKDKLSKENDLLRDTLKAAKVYVFDAEMARTGVTTSKICLDIQNALAVSVIVDTEVKPSEEIFS